MTRARDRAVPGPVLVLVVVEVLLNLGSDYGGVSESVLVLGIRQFVIVAGIAHRIGSCSSRPPLSSL